MILLENSIFDNITQSFNNLILVNYKGSSSFQICKDLLNQYIKLITAKRKECIDKYAANVSTIKTYQSKINSILKYNDVTYVKYYVNYDKNISIDMLNKKFIKPYLNITTIDGVKTEKLQGTRFGRDGVICKLCGGDLSKIQTNCNIGEYPDCKDKSIDFLKDINIFSGIKFIYDDMLYILKTLKNMTREQYDTLMSNINNTIYEKNNVKLFIDYITDIIKSFMLIANQLYINMSVISNNVVVASNKTFNSVRGVANE